MKLKELQEYADKDSITMTLYPDTGITEIHFKFQGHPIVAQSDTDASGIYAFSFEGNPKKFFEALSTPVKTNIEIKA